MFYPGFNNYQQQNIVRVSGENGAKAYSMAPNSSAILLDEYEAAIWVKITDGAGYPTITKYRIEECKPDKTLEERIARLEEVLNGKSYHTADEQE